MFVPIYVQVLVAAVCVVLVVNLLYQRAKCKHYKGRYAKLSRLHRAMLKEHFTHWNDPEIRPLLIRKSAQMIAEKQDG